MAPRLAVASLPAPTAGMNINGAPHLLPNNVCQYLLNMVPRPGHVRSRGGARRAHTPLGSFKALKAVLPYSPKLYGLVFTDNTTLLIDAEAGTTAASTASATKRPVGRGITISQQKTYAATEGPNKIMRYDPPLTTGVDFGGTSLSTGPTATLVATHEQRLIAFDANNMYWTDVGGAPANLITEWQDDFTGLTNLLPTPEKIVAAISHQGQLLMFGQRRLYTLTGTAPSNWAIRLVADVGCRGSISVSAIGQLVAFFGDNGMYLFDGVSSPRLVSDAIAPLIRSYTRGDDYTNGWATVEAMDEETLAVSVGTKVGSNYVSQFSGYYNVRYNAWGLTQYGFPSAGFSGDVGWVMPGPSLPLDFTFGNRAMAWDGRSLVALENMGAPELSGLDMDFGGTNYTTTTKIRYRRAQLGSVLSKAQLHRIYNDLVISGGQSWTLSVLDVPAGSTLASVMVQPASTGVFEDPVRGPSPGRTVSDVFQEVGDVDILLQSNAVATGAGSYKAGVFDTYLEHQVTRDSPG